MNSELAFDRTLVGAWVAGRSLVRGLPPPVLDRGGFRVDTGSDVEVRRWVFPGVEPGLADLGGCITAPRNFIKLCGPVDALRRALPSHWTVQPTGFFMIATGPWPSRALPAGYTLELEEAPDRTHAQVRTAEGEVAASGYLAETPRAVVYDRIVTALEHRRRGLGQALLTALRESRKGGEAPELLVATEVGRMLYEGLGWRTLSTYTTACIESA